ncbi:unnamed protein product [Phytophthora fragariaefolia]|uniref:Unnamed protein product n=1 Tax=Phytophthora fragariaefolia TaxID=1490495 RepID=A0A9W7CMC6_9STRA|nr:unnamed protein product [Phytophthora fragariaefolia]
MAGKANDRSSSNLFSSGLVVARAAFPMRYDTGDGSGICWHYSGGLYTSLEMHVDINELCRRHYGNGNREKMMATDEFASHHSKLQHRRNFSPSCKLCGSMEFSGVVKLKFGPFWFKTTILLVSVLAFGLNAKYVLRVGRSAISSGHIDLPIGYPGFPVDLLPRTTKDRRKLRFSIRYGSKGKILCFLAPTAEIYAMWIMVLDQTFKHGIQAVKRARNETDGGIENKNVGSDGGGQFHDYLVHSVNDSMLGQRGSTELEMWANSSVCVSDRNIDSDYIYAARCRRLRCADHSATEKSELLSPRGDVDDIRTTDSSGVLTPTSSMLSTIRHHNSLTFDNDKEHQNVFCMATDDSNMTDFSVYSPAKSTSDANASRVERIFKMSSTEWTQWLAHDIRHNVALPEVFHLTIHELIESTCGPHAVDGTKHVNSTTGTSPTLTSSTFFFKMLKRACLMQKVSQVLFKFWLGISLIAIAVCRLLFFSSLSSTSLNSFKRV